MVGAAEIDHTMRHDIGLLPARVGDSHAPFLLTDMLQQRIGALHGLVAPGILPEIRVGYQRGITMHNTCLCRHIAHKCSKHGIYCRAERKRKMQFHTQKSTIPDTTPVSRQSQAAISFPISLPRTHVRAQRGYRLRRQAQISPTPQAWISSGRPAAGYRFLCRTAQASRVHWEPLLRD